MSELNSRFKKIIYERLRDDLGTKIVHPYGSDIWVLDEETKTWFFQVESKGDLWFNQKYFNNFFALFSMGSTQYSKILKEWIEKVLEIRLKSCSRKNTNYDYLIDGVISESTENYVWKDEKRFGFSYKTVKKFYELQNKSERNRVELLNYF